MKVTIDNKDIDAKDSSTALDVAREHAKGAVVAKINGNLAGLSTILKDGDKLEFFSFDTKEGRETFMHSASHLMAHAIKHLYPNAKFTIGPAVDQGFYYDIDAEPFKPEDFKKIEEEMHKIVKQNLQIVRKEISKADALKLFADNPYKTEMINELDEGTITIYEQGDFVDLCRGPHVPSTGYIKAYKLTKVAGAYWRGNSNNKMLQRVYGIAFPEKDKLKEYLKMIEEAEKRDHRKLGRELDLFSIHDEGPGFVFFHPKGMIVWKELEKLWREEHAKRGYQEVKTPIILSKELWLRSGHWDHYKENMYFTKIDDREFAVKPMNCPGGILIYKSALHSYRELPLRIGEMGLVHRHELSGVLTGMFRVRCFVQDDAHIYCTPEQVKDEIKSMIDLFHHFYSNIFKLEYHVELSTRPEKAMGDVETWNTAEKILEEAVKEKKIPFKINPGDGAFYGPKLDFHIKDCIGRTWQCGTIQLDFQMPEKFDLTYEGADGTKHRPVMLHRVVYGSMERFFGILIEHYAGKFPLWLAPVQVVLLTVADRNAAFADRIKEKLVANGIRVETDYRSESIPKKVRDAELQKIPYIVTIGDKEEKEELLAVRSQGKNVTNEKTEEFIAMLVEKIKGRAV